MAPKAIISVPRAAPRAVATKTAPLSIPAAPKISEFTASMYAMVIKVVIPAVTSTLMELLFSRSLKTFSKNSAMRFCLLICRILHHK